MGCLCDSMLGATLTEFRFPPCWAFSQALLSILPLRTRFLRLEHQNLTHKRVPPSILVGHWLDTTSLASLLLTFGSRRMVAGGAYHAVIPRHSLIKSLHTERGKKPWGGRLPQSPLLHSQLRNIDSTSIIWK